MLVRLQVLLQGSERKRGSRMAHRAIIAFPSLSSAEHVILFLFKLTLTFACFHVYCHCQILKKPGLLRSHLNLRPRHSIRTDMDIVTCKRVHFEYILFSPSETNIHIFKTRKGSYIFDSYTIVGRKSNALSFVRCIKGIMS